MTCIDEGWPGDAADYDSSGDLTSTLAVGFADLPEACGWVTGVVWKLRVAKLDGGGYDPELDVDLYIEAQKQGSTQSFKPAAEGVVEDWIFSPVVWNGPWAREQFNTAELRLVADTASKASIISVDTIVVVATYADAVVETAAGVAIKGALRQYLSEHGEAVVYRPNGGVPREVLAAVKRDVPTPIPGTDRNTPMTTMQVVNDIEDGIGGAELDPRTDRVDIAIRFGDTPQTRGFGHIIHQYEHSLTMEVR